MNQALADEGDDFRAEAQAQETAQAIKGDRTGALLVKANQASPHRNIKIARAMITCLSALSVGLLEAQARLRQQRPTALASAALCVLASDRC